MIKNRSTAASMDLAKVVGEDYRSSPMLRLKIRVKGQINRNWSDWLGELDINHTDDGNTILGGSVRDQSCDNEDNAEDQHD